MPIIHANDASFDTALRSKGRVIVKFGADWCKPCKLMEPLIRDVASSTDRVAVIDVDTEESPEVTERFAVRGLPTFLLMEGDRELARKSGTVTKATLMEWVKD